MKVRTSVKAVCRNCKIVRRKGVLRVICSAEPNTSNVKANLVARPTRLRCSAGLGVLTVAG